MCECRNHEAVRGRGERDCCGPIVSNAIAVEATMAADWKHVLADESGTAKVEGGAR